MTQPVTILGAGIVGICTAVSLAERGVAVRVIDRGAPGQETSFGNAGVISPWSFIPQSLPGTWRNIPQLMFGAARPLSVRLGAWPRMLPWGLHFLRNGTEQKTRQAADAMQLLCAPSVELFARHLSGTGHDDLLRDSMYVHAFRNGSRANLGALDYAIRREKGADLELIGADALRQTEPALSSEFQAAILIKGQVRATSPGRIAQVLADKAQRLGARFIKDEIRAVQRIQAGWRITCTQETYESEQMVLAMGAWSMEVLRPLGIKLPLMAERGYHVEFPTPEIGIENSVMDVDGKFVASSMESGARFAGQAEFAPIDAPKDPGKQALLTRLAKNAFPGLNTAAPQFWMGRRPSFPDSLPVLGELQDQKGLFVNFGHSHYGLMMAPKSGEILADLLTDRRPNTDLAAFAAERF